MHCGRAWRNAGESDAQNDGGECVGRDSTGRPPERRNEKQGRWRQKEAAGVAGKRMTGLMSEAIADGAAEVRGEDKNEAEEGNEGEQAELEVLSTAKKAVPRPEVLGEGGEDEDDDVDDEEQAAGAHPSSGKLRGRAGAAPGVNDQRGPQCVILNMRSALVGEMSGIADAGTATECVAQLPRLAGFCMPSGSDRS